MSIQYYAVTADELKCEATHKSLGRYFKKEGDQWLLASTLEPLWLPYTPRDLEYFLKTVVEIGGEHV